MKIYSRTGDDGTTGLFLGGRVPKNDLRCEANGEIDFAISAMGMARSLSKKDRTKNILLKIQRDLYTVSSELAVDTAKYNSFKKDFITIDENYVQKIEEWIDELTQVISIPNKFIIPGDSLVSSTLDLARSSIRTAERRIVELQDEAKLNNQRILNYVNRVSDLLFTLARYEDSEISPTIVLNTKRNENSESHD
ncbi:MAG: cob(I)yrinic acid a,c-diamide adenosyltransferase [Dehalococcoidia bacterium]